MVARPTHGRLAEKPAKHSSGKRSYGNSRSCTGSLFREKKDHFDHGGPSAEIGKGTFGMAEETGRYLNLAISEGAEKGLGLGESVGNMLVREKFPFNRYSLLARAFELDIPVTVHVAVGTDIIHFHPLANGSDIGSTSHLDFRIFCRLVSELDQGVLINLGSAVILPEVFLKALSVARNLGHTVKDITTVNMDFIRQYRPMTNAKRIHPCPYMNLNVEIVMRNSKPLCFGVTKPYPAPVVTGKTSNG